MQVASDPLPILDEVKVLFGLAETTLGFQPLGDVPPCRNPPQAGVGRHGAQADLHRKLLPVGPSAEQPQARAHAASARLDAISSAVRTVHLPEAFGEQFVDRTTHEVAAAVAEQLL